MRATHPALFLAACVFVALATGCPKDPDFIECRDDTSCDRFTGGRCLVNGETSNQFCAYPDESCPSGMRWSDRDVEDSISGMCVANIQDAGPDAPIDGPAVDAGPDAAPADASMAPVTSGQNADMVIGQNDLTLGAPNSGGESASSLSGPVRVWSDGTRLWVGDNSNARALQWNTIPIVDRPVANVIVGQASATATTSATTQSSFRIGDIAPFAVGTKLIVADGTSNRVLIYDSIPSANGANASLVLGQASFTTSTGGKSGRNQGSCRVNRQAASRSVLAAA